MTTEVKLIATGSILALALATQVGCAGHAKVTQPAEQAAPTQNEAAKPILAGKVVETMNAGGYTYLCLEKDGKRGWAAVPAMDVKVGDEIALVPGAEMGPFTSKTLNRTFDKIIFSGGPVTKPGTEPVKQPAAQPVAQSAAMPPGHPTLPAAPVQKDATGQAVKMPASEYGGKVVETMNSGGYTYLCLEKNGKKNWAAIPATEVKIGDEIELLPGTEMGKFTSKTLNRTFDNIFFSGGIVPK